MSIMPQQPDSTSENFQDFGKAFSFVLHVQRNHSNYECPVNTAASNPVY